MKVRKCNLIELLGWIVCSRSLKHELIQFHSSLGKNEELDLSSNSPKLHMLARLYNSLIHNVSDATDRIYIVPLFHCTLGHSRLLKLPSLKMQPQDHQLITYATIRQCFDFLHFTDSIDQLQVDLRPELPEKLFTCTRLLCGNVHENQGFQFMNQHCS